jgi:hypothetical protein
MPSAATHKTQLNLQVAAAPLQQRMAELTLTAQVARLPWEAP